MTDYRVYCYAGGENLWADDRFLAADDGDAIALVSAMKEIIEAEVWKDGRLVGTVARPRKSRVELGPQALRARSL